jgi:hypothetical protein
MQCMGQRPPHRFVVVDHQYPHPASITHVLAPAFRIASDTAGQALLGLHERSC